jgi:hypothetical protein
MVRQERRKGEGQVSKEFSINQSPVDVLTHGDDRGEWPRRIESRSLPRPMFDLSTLSVALMAGKET